MNPLTPYMTLIKVAAAILLVCIVFVGGCNYGKSSQASTVATLQSDLSVALVANKKYEDLNNERRRLDKLAAQENDRQEKAALAAGKRTEKVQQEQKSTEDNNQHALQRALRDPKCDELLRMKLCPVVPLP